MDSKQAIKILNGSEKSPIWASERDEIVELIEWQERMILRAIALTQEANGGCPFPSGCSRIKDDEWALPCTMFNDDAKIVSCWRRWLEQEAQHDQRQNCKRCAVKEGQ